MNIVNGKVQFTSRFAVPLYKKLVKAAKENKRSLMGEIVFRLEQSFKK